MTDMKNIDLNELKNAEVFKVPENYFNTLTDRVMSQIPAEETKIISINRGKKNSGAWWKWSSAAACIALLIVGTTLLTKTTKTTTDEASNLTASYDEKSQEETMDYMMLDTDDVYSYLSGESY